MTKAPTASSITLGSLVNTVLKQVAKVLIETPCRIVKKCCVEFLFLSFADPVQFQKFQLLSPFLCALWVGIVLSVF